MKLRIASQSLLALCLVLAAVPAAASPLECSAWSITTPNTSSGEGTLAIASARSAVGAAVSITATASARPAVGAAVSITATASAPLVERAGDSTIRNASALFATSSAR